MDSVKKEGGLLLADFMAAGYLTTALPLALVNKPKGIALNLGGAALGALVGYAYVAPEYIDNEDDADVLKSFHQISGGVLGALAGLLAGKVATQLLG